MLAFLADHGLCAAGMLAVAICAVIFALSFVQDAAERKLLQDTLSELKTLSKRPSGVVAFITGANSGIGFHLAKELAAAGVEVILGCRSKSRGEEALRTVRKAGGAAAKASLCIVDVSDPASVREAAQGLRRTLKKLDLLYCNAGIMPVERFNWAVGVQAALTGGLRYFLETGRAHAGSSHFLLQPHSGHDYSAHGAPSVFATHVLGHALLVQELQLLLRAGRMHGNDPAGRVIWSASRAATDVLSDLECLAVPPAAHSGTANAKGGHAESYGEAKYATDLYSAALIKRGTASIAVCPGAVMTHMTPTFLRFLTPVLVWFRPLLPGFNVTVARGITAHAVMATAALREVSQPGRKNVLWWGGVQAASAGAPPVTEEAADAMYELVQQWIETAWAGK